MKEAKWATDLELAVAVNQNHQNECGKGTSQRKNQEDVSENKTIILQILNKL